MMRKLDNASELSSVEIVKMYTDDLACPPTLARTAKCGLLYI
jgi:hypothetical protein